MGTTTLLYDPEVEDDSLAKLLESLADREVDAVPFDTCELPALPDGAIVLVWLSDQDLSQFLPQAVERGWRVGFLPHPELRHGQLGFGVSPKVADAVEDIFASEEAVEVDLFYCNNQVVLNSVVIGDPFAATRGTAATEGIVARIRRFVVLLRWLRTANPSRFTLTTSKGKVLETTALGIVAVEHGRSAVLSRRIIKDSNVNDGAMHALIYAPRSVLTMVWFLFTSLFLPRQRGGNPLPSFVGHIKASGVRVTSPRPVKINLDGRRKNAKTIELKVTRGVLSLFPGRHLQVDKSVPDEKEVFRTNGLPTGEVLGELKDRPLPLINHATPEEFRELFQILRESARTSETYIILLVLSTLLATFGLFANSAPVIIGAMILAPLMSPIVALAMAAVRQSEKALQRESLRSLFIGIPLALACATLLASLSPLRTINSEIAARLNPTLLDMGVAVISGIAGAYAHARSEIARSLAGVAISVALVPPLAVAGIGLGWFDLTVFWGASLLFLTNLAGIILAAAATFLLMGYSPFGYSRRGLGLSLFLVGVVSLLLTPGFVRMVNEHRIIGVLDGCHTCGVELQEVRVRPGQPMRIYARLLADEPMSLEVIDEVKSEIQRMINREIVLEANVVVVRGAARDGNLNRRQQR